MGRTEIKVCSKELRIVELHSSPSSPCIEIEFDYFEFDPAVMAESFFSDWYKFWMRNEQLNDDFYST